MIMPQPAVLRVSEDLLLRLAQDDPAVYATEHLNQTPAPRRGRGSIRLYSGARCDYARLACVGSTQQHLARPARPAAYHMHVARLCSSSNSMCPPVL